MDLSWNDSAICRAFRRKLTAKILDRIRQSRSALPDTVVGIAEYTYNSIDHSTTQHSPFFVCNGRDPWRFQPLDTPKRDTLTNAEEMSQELQQLHEDLKTRLVEAPNAQ